MHLAKKTSGRSKIRSWLCNFETVVMDEIQNICSVVYMEFLTVQMSTAQITVDVVDSGAIGQLHLGLAF